MSEPPKRISIIIPVYNEGANVGVAYRAILDVFKEIKPSFELEFLFTDNHSTDETFSELEALARQDKRVKVLRFNRNYGYQRSVLTAYQCVSGDAAIQIDCDLQDPPSMIPSFIDLWLKGHDVVSGTRQNRQEPKLLTMARRGFYKLMKYASSEPTLENAGDFRLVDRTVLDRLRKIYDLQPYVRGLVSSLAANEIGLPHDRVRRTIGKSKFPVFRLVLFAFDGLIAQSTLLLRLASLAGMTISAAICVLILIYFFGAVFSGSTWPEGFATTTLLLLFSISLNALFLGIIGEYIGRLYQLARKKPLTVVERALNISTENIPQ